MQGAWFSRWVSESRAAASVLEEVAEIYLEIGVAPDLVRQNIQETVSVGFNYSYQPKLS